MNRSCVPMRVSTSDSSVDGPGRPGYCPGRDRGVCPRLPPGSARRSIRSAAAAHPFAGRAGKLRCQPNVAPRLARSPRRPLRRTGPLPSAPSHQKELAVPHSNGSARDVVSAVAALVSEGWFPSKQWRCGIQYCSSLRRFLTGKSFEHPVSHLVPQAGPGAKKAGMERGNWSRLDACSAGPLP